MTIELTRVLIAEAETTSQQAIHQGLLDADVPADVALDTTAVIQCLQKKRYDVLLLDLADPLIDPQGVLGSLAALDPAQQPIVIALGTAEAARSLESELVHVVIRKPVSLAQLVPIVQTCVRELARREHSPSTEGQRPIRL